VVEPTRAGDAQRSATATGADETRRWRGHERLRLLGRATRWSSGHHQAVGAERQVRDQRG